MSGRFVIEKSTDSQFYFNLKAGNNEIILTSELYKAKASALKGIESVKVNAPHDDRYQRRDGAHFSFDLKAKNGEIIGRSETYTARAGRDNGIESVKKNAPDAEVRDETGAD